MGPLGDFSLPDPLKSGPPQPQNPATPVQSLLRISATLYLRFSERYVVNAVLLR